MSRVTPPFNPRIPTADPEAQQFGINVSDFLNQPIRNEISVPIGVPPAPASLGLWSALYVVTVRKAGWSPFRDGFTLRRVRLVKPSATYKTTVTLPSVAIRALVQVGERETEVGTFSTQEFALKAGRSRNISGIKDIAFQVPAGSVLTVEATYSVIPPLAFDDAVVVFDLGLV